MRKQDRSGQYFQTKRPSQLIQSSEPLSKVSKYKYSTMPLEKVVIFVFHKYSKCPKTSDTSVSVLK